MAATLRGRRVATALSTPATTSRWRRLAEILGCRPIDYSGRTECCGFHTAAHDERVAIKLTGQHILAAKTGGAQTMVTPCPLCHTVLDGFQREIERISEQKLDMPVLHLPATRRAWRSACRRKNSISTGT